MLALHASSAQLKAGARRVVCQAQPSCVLCTGFNHGNGFVASHTTVLLQQLVCAPGVSDKYKHFILPDPCNSNELNIRLSTT